MDIAHWPLETVMKPMEEIIVQNNSCSSKPASLERRVRPQKEQALNCPRCNSTNTKFCYYNNYSLSQPRYFCKTCRRYWTEGGSLRNIPVGGGSRKNKKFSSTPSTNSSISSSSQKLHLSQSHHDLALQSQSNFQSPNSKICKEGKHQGQDLNLGFPSHQNFKTISELIQVPSFDNQNIHNPNSSSHHLSALELLTGTSPNTSRGLNSFTSLPVSDQNSFYSSGFAHLQEFKPTLNFSLDENIIGSGGGYGMQESVSGRVLFPFENLKQVSNSYIDQQNKGEQGGDSTGYWNGVLRGGGSW